MLFPKFLKCWKLNANKKYINFQSYCKISMLRIIVIWSNLELKFRVMCEVLSLNRKIQKLLQKPRN